jgi:hypothetical protein
MKQSPFRRWPTPPPDRKTRRELHISPVTAILLLLAIPTIAELVAMIANLLRGGM